MRLRYSPLSMALAHAIATDIVNAGNVSTGADQPAGVGNNSQQPAHGVPLRGGQEGDAARPDGDDFHCGTGPDDEDAEEGAGGALPGETDYLDAHDLVDWEQAPFAATAWAIGRRAATAQDPEPAPIARWLWVGADDKVTGTLAPDFGVVLHPGRGMTIKRPPGIELIARTQLVLP